MLGDVDIDLAIQYKDSLLKSDKSLSNFDKEIVVCILGEIHIKYELYQEAMDYFNIAVKLGGDSPRVHRGKAICYVKLDNLDKAFIEINKAIIQNDSYYWYLGNLYEIIGEKEKAIEQYIYLYNTDKEFYTYCKERADYLKTNDAILYTEIIQDFDFGYVLLN